MKSDLMVSSKKLKLDMRSFQEFWTTDFGFVSRNDQAECALCYQNVVCRTSSIKRLFETKHEKSFKDDAEKIESLKKAVSLYKKQRAFSRKLFVARIEQLKVATKLRRSLLKKENHLLMGVCKGGLS